MIGVRGGVFVLADRGRRSIGEIDLPSAKSVLVGDLGGVLVLADLGRSPAVSVPCVGELDFVPTKSSLVGVRGGVFVLADLGRRGMSALGLRLVI